MSDVLIRCEEVGKIFCRDLRRSLWYGVTDIASDLIPREQRTLPKRSTDIQLRNQEFWANQDVSFEVQRGECLGLIGRNGAGKTTLLKMLNGLIKPDTGRIEMRGRVGAMIALGAGFNPILTARENIYVNGSILGLGRKQISRRLDEIIEFSELEDFIDSPVRTFSSGMQVRLGFAVATLLLKPDVLILDEVMAVGDIRFRAKCYRTINEMMHSAAVILVTHTMPHVSLFCSHSMLLDKGRTVFPAGDPNLAIECYNELLNPSDETPEGYFKHLEPPALAVNTEISATRVSNEEMVYLDLTVECSEPVLCCYPRVTLFSPDDRAVIEWNSLRGESSVSLAAGTNHLRCTLGRLPLRAGVYFLGAALFNEKNGPAVFITRKCNQIHVVGNATGASECQFSGDFSVSQG